MTEARWSVVVISLIIWGGVTAIFGGVLKNYSLAAGAGFAAALVFGVVSYFLADDGDKRLHEPPKGANEEQ
jgi:hypothetical protein